VRQVPSFTEYLILGRGRVATHFSRYFKLLGLPFQQWDRSQPEDLLPKKAEHCSHALFLMSDDAIEPFLQNHGDLFNQMVRVHFSGALCLESIHSAHPLYTFPVRLYDLATYQAIPFVIDPGMSWGEVLPGLSNPAFSLDPEQKTFYHALCVMSGNFTTMLWEKAFAEFDAKLGLPREALLPYLGQICANLEAGVNGKSVLTGPLVRNDLGTIEKHVQALEGDPFQEVYKSFVAAHEKQQ
jgi:2-dehydropantoate 2-reductase